MNNLIRFRPANSHRRLEPGDRGGQILFFTGVRYQRMTEDSRAPVRQAQGARRKRQPTEVGSERKSRR
jgi:hypothetical protein